MENGIEQGSPFSTTCTVTLLQLTSFPTSVSSVAGEFRNLLLVVVVKQVDIRLSASIPTFIPSFFFGKWQLFLHHVTLVSWTHPFCPRRRKWRYRTSHTGRSTYFPSGETHTVDIWQCRGHQKDWTIEVATSVDGQGHRVRLVHSSVEFLLVVHVNGGVFSYASLTWSLKPIAMRRQVPF